MISALTDMIYLLAKVMCIPFACKVIQVLEKISTPHSVRVVFFPKTLPAKETHIGYRQQINHVRKGQIITFNI